jgi:hypothetical protein
MKLFFLVIGINMLISGCFNSTKKLFIKSVRLDNNKHIDWYFFSNTSNFSRSYLQFKKNNSETVLFFESFFLSDINEQADTLTIQIYKNDYKLYENMLKDRKIVVIIDTTGGIWNQASSRLGRLIRKNVDVTKFHYTDSFCPKMECE